ncbi:endonuclease domain-containing protein [Sphingomonas sp. CLY1604]|uniref:endonuclease domain-containing protein n=1 Tax=Sphingomonas sp. CLY1604 TaxID=3457786 RepID=UPI003FD7D5DC
MAIPRKPGATVRRSRRLRREMSPAEVALWCELRQRPAGLKFRRQHPAGRFSIDFFCAAARLAIEVDGEAHDRGEQPARDVERNRWLAEHGIRTLRVPAALVFREMENVVAGIVAAANARLPLHHRPAAGGPPPQAELGEE